MSDLAIYYEHPTWFEPLFTVLERRGVSFTKIDAHDQMYDVGSLTAPAPVIFNRLAMSSFLRQSEHAIFYTQAVLAHWELSGARVINGSEALRIDASKARQLSLLRSLGLPIPATRVVHRRADLPRAASQMRFPLIAKPNVGGSGSGVVRYDSAEALQAAVADGSAPVGVDGVTLLQDYVPARAARVMRCEMLAGKLLYAIALNGVGATFDLCPADVCMADKPSISIEAFRPPADIERALESVARAAALDVGGIEYMIDDRDGVARFYDINALSNFVAQPRQILGFDPHEPLADFLMATIAAGRRAV